MAANVPQARPTIGVLAGWQFYRTATNLSYLAPVFRGSGKAAQTLGCYLLRECGMIPSASPADPLRPAGPTPAPEYDFVPIGPWNTDGLIIVVPLPSPARSAYIQDLRANGHPILFVGSGGTGPTIVTNNTGGILEGPLAVPPHCRSAAPYPAALGGCAKTAMKSPQSARFSSCPAQGHSIE